MSVVNIINVIILDNLALFFSLFQFEIFYECLILLKDGIFLFYLGFLMNYFFVIEFCYVENLFLLLW